jgi:DNA primase
MPQQWIDFKALRRELNFEQVLVTYGAKLNVRDTNKGKQHSGRCPLPGCQKGATRKAFSANLDQGIWQAFCCKRSGNLLDFIVICEGLNPSNGADIRKAAEIAQKRFLDGKVTGASPEPKAELPLDMIEERATTVLVNAPLDFELKSLDPEHPWFEEHGLSKDTVRHFGLGYCVKGWLKGRIAIPLHDSDGKLIGYAGRLLDRDEVTEQNPLYLFPAARVHKGIRYEFEASRVIYSGRASGAGDPIVATSPDDVWRLWQSGFKSATCTFSI